MAAPRHPISIVGTSALLALIYLFLSQPALTSIWLAAIATGIICGGVLRRSPRRRLNPSDLRNAPIFEQQPAGQAMQVWVESGFAQKFVRPFPDLLIVAAVSFLVARLMGWRVNDIFGSEVAGSVFPCELLATLVAVLAGRVMLVKKTDEFILRVREYPIFSRMALNAGLLVFAFGACAIPWMDIPEMTQPGPNWYVATFREPRKKTISRTLSDTGKVGLEVVDAGAGVQELWVRDRAQLKNKSMVGRFLQPLDVRISKDDRWIAVTYLNKRNARTVDLFERAEPKDGESLRYSTPSRLTETNLYLPFRDFYVEATKDGERLTRGRPSLSARGFAPDRQLALELVIESLPESQQVPEWKCTYDPETGKFTSVSPVDIINNASLQAIEDGEAPDFDPADARSKTKMGPPGKLQSAVLPGERFPETRQRLLEESEVRGWASDKLRYALNEMFARHGADLLKPELNQWFSQFDWYRTKKRVPIDYIENQVFTPIERRNLELLGKIRDEKRGFSR